MIQSGSKKAAAVGSGIGFLISGLTALVAASLCATNIIKAYHDTRKNSLSYTMDTQVK